MSERGLPVVKFNEHGGLPPVVFFHTYDHEDLNLRALAEYLGPEQPLYGLEPPPSVAGAMPEVTEDWIAFHRPLLDSLPIGPPYWLAGFSYGGVVALEVARQLQDQGTEVAWLGLVDSMRPRLNPPGVRKYLRYHLREIRGLSDNGYRLRYLRKMQKGGTHRTKIRIKIKMYRVLAALHLVEARPRTLGDAKGMTPLKRSVIRSYLTYEATPYEHPVALFSGAGSRETALGDVNLRWIGYLTGPLEVTELEGEHLELFSPENIHSVGGALRASLARCREATAADAGDRHVAH